MEEMYISLDTVTYNGVGGFKFVTNSAKENYISNETIQIKCGNLITSALDGEVFFFIEFIPDNIPLIIPSRLFDIFFYDNIAKNISTYKKAESFISSFNGTFSRNEWYSVKWLIRLIALTKLTLEEKILLLRNFKCLNTLQLVLLNLNKQIPYSAEEILDSIIFRVAPTSSTILSKIDLLNRIKEKVVEFEHFTTFFNIPKILLDELESIEIENVLDISYFNLDYYDNFARENLYATMKRVAELNETIFDYFAVRFREAENQIRLELGYSSVGSLFTESLLLKSISEHYPHYQIISQYSPSWLKPQRFDIYIAEKNIAIEYNGIQHYEKVEYFGGELGLLNTQKRDTEKRKKCKANKCTLIEVRYDENFEEALQRIVLLVDKIK